MECKLTDEQVIAIHVSHASLGWLAKKYGVSYQLVQKIKRGISRPHLKLGPTRHYHELITEKMLGLPRRKREKPPELSVTGIELLDEEGDPEWFKIKAEGAARRAAAASLQEAKDVKETKNGVSTTAGQ